MFKREGKAPKGLEMEDNSTLIPLLKFVLLGIGFILAISFFAYFFLDFRGTNFNYVFNEGVEVSMRREGLKINTENNIISYTRGTWKGCNVDFDAWMERDGYEIKIYETWENEAPRCGKFYVIKGTIKNLEKGNYTFAIYEKNEDQDIRIAYREIELK